MPVDLIYKKSDRELHQVVSYEENALKEGEQSMFSRIYTET